MSTNIYELIEQKMPTFSKGQKRIANAILSHYDKTAFMTAAKLGQTVGVSESTVVRFATELGFEGYPEFQHAVQKLIRAKLTPMQRIQMTNTYIGDSNLITKVMNDNIDKIRRAQDNLDRHAFDSAVTHILEAKRVFIIGVRSTFCLASFLHFNLSMIMNNIFMIQPSSTSEVLEQIMDINEGDVLIAISFPRYSTKIIKAVRYAKAKNAKIISLTDGVNSPLAEDTDDLLAVESDIISFMDSLIAPMSILNALLTAITVRCPGEISARFEQLESIWDEFDVYAKR